MLYGRWVFPWREKKSDTPSSLLYISASLHFNKASKFCRKIFHLVFSSFLCSVSQNIRDLMNLCNPHGLLGRQPEIPSIKGKSYDVTKEHFPVPLKQIFSGRCYGLSLLWFLASIPLQSFVPQRLSLWRNSSYSNQ